MSEAPESVVRAVMETLGCGPYRSASGWCKRHATITLHGPTGARLTERGCEFAVSLADAAWAAAYPEALRDAAERLDWVKPDVCPCDHPEACCGSEEACDAMQPSVRVIGASDLRRWADESGSGRGQD